MDNELLIQDAVDIDIVITQDADSFMSFISNPESDLSVLADSDNVNLYIIKLLQQVIISNKETNQKLLKSDNRVAELENRCSDLKEELSHRTVEINDLKHKVLTLEQYSRRSTIIMTGVPFEKDEKLEEKVGKVVNDTNILNHDIDFTFISHVHRNKQKEQKEGQEGPPPPPSITLQLVRSSDVDKLFYNKKKLREFYGNKINIFHAMSKGTIDQKSKIENCAEVAWVDYRGHSQLFAVKLLNGDFLKGVKDLPDLESKVGKLTQK